jgi:predicted HicB family RNase H-like nuclease
MRQSVHIRAPLSLLERLRERADAEQVSLNTLVVALLASAIGYPVEDGEQ